MVWSGLDWRILPAACEIITHLISQDLPINGQSDALLKEAESNLQQLSDRGSNEVGYLLCPLLPLWIFRMNQFYSIQTYSVCVCVSHALFYICRRMSSAVLSAVILLACALAFSAAQSECNLCGFCTA